MRVAFTPPPCPDSPLRRLDPRWKLAALLLILLTSVLLRSLMAASVALCGALALAALGRLPARWLLGRLAALVGVATLFALPLPFLAGGDEPAWGWGGVRVSAHGLRLAGLLVCKSATVGVLALVLLASAPVDATLKAAHALRLPGLLVQLGLLSYRYLFLLGDELGRLRVAVRVRGYRNRATWHGYKTVGNLAGTLLVRGYERAERVGQAMRCRGFDGQFRSLTEFHTGPADVLFLALAVGFGLGLCWLDGLLPG